MRRFLLTSYSCSIDFLFPALVILLYIGVMDDILEMKAYKKLIGQIVIATMMVVGSDVRIRSFVWFVWYL